jgi:hypothetical protein
VYLAWFFSIISTARACALNIFFKVSPSSSSPAASARVECDSMRMRRRHFCATLIQGSIRLAAATLPSRTASRRFRIDSRPLLVLFGPGLELRSGL